MQCKKNSLKYVAFPKGARAEIAPKDWQCHVIGAGGPVEDQAREMGKLGDRPAQPAGRPQEIGDVSMDKQLNKKTNPSLSKQDIRRKVRMINIALSFCFYRCSAPLG